MHEHTYAGQKLRHEHPGGDLEHGYYEHTEDPRPATSPVADALARVDRAQALTGPRAESVELAALRNLAEVARASLLGLADPAQYAAHEAGDDPDELVYGWGRSDVERIAGRALTADELEAAAKSIEYSSAGGVIREAITAALGAADDEDGE